MNIAIIAANGRLGQALVKEALNEGHTVTAGTHSRNPFATHPNLTVTKCDATNTDDVAALIAGHDVVFSCIGHVKGSPADVQTAATRTVIDAMRATNLQRFITVTGTGVRNPGDRVTLTDRFLNFGIGIIDPARIKDGRDHVALLKDSSLEWTAIRVLKLQFENNRPYILTPHGPTLPYVSRKETARAMLQVARDNSFLKQLPMLSSAKH
jgi:putative NADH-flavin reductase